MLRLPPFEYVQPATVDEAVAAVAAHAGSAMYVAGGTDVVPNLKRRQFEPERLVSLRGLSELRGVSEDAEGLVLGAGTVLHDLATDPRLGPVAGGSDGSGGALPGDSPGAPPAGGRRSDDDRGWWALGRAAAQVANPQIQRMGTLGGNLCVDTRCNYYNQTHEWRKSIGFCLKKDGDICLVAPGSRKCWAVSSSDTAPVVMALDGRVELVGPEGSRRIPAGSLYRDDGIDYLTRRPEEILTRVLLPRRPGRRATYRKVRRRGSFDFPILDVAAAVELEDDVVRRARLVLGAVHTYPVEIAAAREILEGERPARERIEAVADAAHRAATPLDNADLTLYWRKRVVRTEVRRAFEELLAPC